MKTLRIILAVLLVTGVIAFLLQWQSLRALQMQLNELRHIVGGGTESAKTPLVENISPEELKQLQQDHLELLRLRRDVGELQRSSNLVAQIEAERTAQQTAVAREELLRATSAYHKANRALMNPGHEWMDLLRFATSGNTGTIPTSWDQAWELAQPAFQKLKYAEKITPHYARLYDEYKANSDSNVFEIVALTLSLNGSPPQLHAAIRERIPRAVPGGGWARVYGIGRVGLGYVEVPDGDFTAFETALQSSTDGLVLHQYLKPAD